MAGLGAYPLAVAPPVEDVARSWPVRWVSRKTEPGHEYTRLRGIPAVYQALLVCGECDQAVASLSPDVEKGSYVTNAGTILAGVVTHLRQCHESQVMPPAPGA